MCFVGFDLRCRAADRYAACLVNTVDIVIAVKQLVERAHVQRSTEMVRRGRADLAQFNLKV